MVSTSVSAVSRQAARFRAARFRLDGLLLAGLVALAPLADVAAEPRKTSHATVELIAEPASLPADGGTVTVGFYLEPDPGWHVYWVNPGDAGQAPKLKWSLPDGFEAGPFRFPAPKLLPFGDLNTYGYHGAVLLLAEIAVPPGLENGRRYELAAAASWVVCDDELCVPERAQVAVTLPAGDGAADRNRAAAFAEARAALPKAVDWPARFEVADGRVHIEIAADGVSGADGVYLFVESRRFVDYGEQTLSFNRGGLAFSMAASRRLTDALTSTPAVLRYTDDAGVERSVGLTVARAGELPHESSGSLSNTSLPNTVSDDAPGVAAADAGGSFSLFSPQSPFAAILAAFLGGVILNLMPCVFPILSMKALSLVKLSQADQRVARDSGIVYTIGILVAFAAIAVALLAIRAGGTAVGWGFQMQNPVVNVGLALLMVAIGLNLFGVFEIGARIVGVGQSLTQGGERRSAFFTGLLAVVVATPCTAPFMAPALGWSLTQPAPVAMAAMLSLGLGLAAPYLLVSLIPSFGRLMPKPGPWMSNLRQVLAFPMLATALWLFWVVGKQWGVGSMTVALLAGLCLAAALWAYGKGALASRRVGWYATAAIAGIACVAAVVEVGDHRTTPQAAGSTVVGKLGGLELERFSPQRVQGYVDAGQPVFVYFTADWCVSCKVNERVALATEEVAQAFEQRGIKVVEADWTAEDPVITEWLHRYDRIGVPLYLYFPKGSTLDTATILPQILLPQTVIDAVERADDGVLQEA